MGNYRESVLPIPFEVLSCSGNRTDTEDIEASIFPISGCFATTSVTVVAKTN